MAYVLEETPQANRYVLESEPEPTTAPKVDYVAPLVERYSPSIEGEPSAMDFLKGLPEAGASLVGGIGGFLAGAPVAAGEVARGVVAGEPVEGFRRAGQEWDKIMEAAAFQPETRFGKVAANVMGQPFVDIQDVVGNATRWWSDKDIEKRVEASKALTNFGFIGAPYIKKGLKEAFKAKAKAVEPLVEGEGAAGGEPPSGGGGPKLMSDKALAELGKLETATPKTVAKVPRNQEIVDVLRVEASKKKGYQKGNLNKIATEIEKLDRDLESIDLSAIKGLSKKNRETRKLVESIITDRKNKEAYIDTGASSSVQAKLLKGQLEEEAWNSMIKEMKAEQRYEPLFQELADRERLRQLGKLPNRPMLIDGKPITGAEEKLLLNIKPVEFITETAAKRLGDLLPRIQREFPGEIRTREFGEKIDRTLKVEEAPVEEAPPKVEKAAPPEKVISEFDTPKIAREEGYTLDKRTFSTEKSATVVATRLGPEWEVVKVGEKYKAAKWIDEKVTSEPATVEVESKISESSSMEELAKTVEVGSEISRKQALKEVESPEGLEFGVAKVGDKYYRTTQKAPMEPTPEVVPTPIVPTELPPVSKDFVQKAREAVEVARKQGDSARLAKEFQKYRNSLAEKINQARESKVEPGDLEVLDDAFRTFASKEEAIKAGRTGNLVQDPLTGRWFEEPKFENLLDEMSEEMSDLPSYEGREGRILSSDELVDRREWKAQREGRIEDLWDILGNERGAVSTEPINFTALKEAVDKVKELVQQAKKSGKSLEEHLNSLNVSKQMKQGVLWMSKNLDKYDKEIENNLRKSLKPSKEEAVKVVQTFEDGLRDVVNSPKKAIKAYVDFLKGTRRIVEDYKEGSGKLPIRQVPWIENVLPEVRKGFEDIWMRTGESPHNVLHRAFDIRNNPAIDAQESHMSQIRNSTNELVWARDILKGIPKSAELLKEELVPLYKKYGEEIRARNRVVSRIANLKSRIALSTNKRRVNKLTDELNQAKIRLAEIDTSLTPLAEGFDAKMKELAPQSADIRIALHAGDALPEGVKLSPEELAISSKIREYMDTTGRALEEVGIPIIKTRTYMPHIWKALTADEGALSFASRMKIPEVMSFLHQLPEGRIWTPSARMILENYIPMAERKIAYQPFLNKWADFANSREYPKLQGYMKDWIDANLYKKGESLLEKGTNALISLEYARLIGLSLSVGFKHLMKLPQTWSRYNATTSLKAIGSEVKVPVQAAMKKLGVKGEFNELELTRAFISQRDLIRSLDEMTALRQIVRSPSLVKKILSQPVVAVEAFDNGVSVMAAAIAGGKTGIRYRQVHNGLWQTILDANFRSGWDQPLWQKKSLVRAATMFASTPFKILEYKIQLVERMLRGERDVFGTHYGTMLMRYIAIIGAAELIARANDTSVLETFLHLPFVGQVGGAAIPPLVDWAVQTKGKGFVEGTKKHFSNWGALTKWMKINRSHYPTKMYDSPVKDLLGLHRLDWEPDMYKSGRGEKLPSLRRTAPSLTR